MDLHDLSDLMLTLRQRAKEIDEDIKKVCQGCQTPLTNTLPSHSGWRHSKAAMRLNVGPI